MKKNNRIIFISFIILVLFIILFSYSNDSQNFSLSFSQDKVWNNTPSFSLIVRTWHGSMLEFYNNLYLSWILFFPHKQWINSDFTVVLDKESQLDHDCGDLLSSLPTPPKVAYEDFPSNGTLCDRWRGIGYTRQLYSTFYLDRYTDKEYIGIMDTDTFFEEKIHPNNFFIDGKPRIFGYNWCCRWEFEKGVQTAIGQSAIGEFMTNDAFPIMMKREHFKEVRDFITKKLKVENFDKAFNKICSTHLMSSPFDIMMNYLWYHKRNDYVWFIQNRPYAYDFDNGDIPRVNKNTTMNKDKEVLAVDKPYTSIALMRNNHVKWNTDTFVHLSKKIKNRKKN